MEQQVEAGFCVLKETVSRIIARSAYRIVNLSELFSGILKQKKVVHDVEVKQIVDEEVEIAEEEEEEDI